MNCLQKKKIYFYLPLVIVLCPTFPNQFSMGTQFLFVIEMLLMLILRQLNVFKFYRSLSANFIVLYFFYATIVSILGEILKGSLILNDFFELARPLAFFMFYSLYRYAVINIEDLERQTIKLVVVLFLIESIYSILEFFFLDNVLPLSYLLYKNETMVIFRNKAIGSFTQIYAYGYILLLPFCYFFISFLYQKRLLSFVKLILVTFALLLTQSKSIYISATLCVLLCFCTPVLYLNWKNVLKNSSFMLILLGLIILLFLSYQEDLYKIFPYALEGLESIAEGNGGTVNTRLEQILWAVYNNQFVLIGAGIGKSEIMLESLYGLYYYRYGLIGLAIFVSIVLFTVKSSYRIARIYQYTDVHLSIFYYALSVFYLVSIIALSSSCHQDTPKISILFYGFMGLIHARYNKIKWPYDDINMNKESCCILK